MRTLTIIPNDRIRRLFYFLLAGGTGFLLYLCISNVMYYLLHVEEVVSVVVATLLPIPPTFWMQRRLTFRSDKPKRRSLPHYALLQLGNALLIGGLTAAGKNFELPAAVVFLIAGAIGIFISYFVQAKFIFADN